MFHDHKLNTLPNYTTIQWDNYGSFTNIGKYSQLIYFLKDLIPNKKICICTEFYDSNIINNSNMDLVVINVSDHPVRFASNLPLTKPIITLDYNFNKSNYHPFHLLFFNWLSTNQRPVDFTKPRKHIVSLVNFKLRVHRIYTYLQLEKKQYYNQIYIRWLKDSSTKLVEDTIDANTLSNILGTGEFDRFLNIRNTFNHIRNRNTEWNNCRSIGLGWRNSYLNIVSEARVEDLGYLTEKIYKPLLAGQLFLVQGAPGSIAYLRRMGFDVFDDYIDHNRYDQELDWQRRTDLMLSVLDDIFPNIESIFFSTTDRRQQNAKWLASDNLKHRCLQSILDQLP